MLAIRDARGLIVRQHDARLEAAHVLAEARMTLSACKMCESRQYRVVTCQKHTLFLYTLTPQTVYISAYVYVSCRAAVGPAVLLRGPLCTRRRTRIQGTASALYPGPADSSLESTRLRIQLYVLYPESTQVPMRHPVGGRPLPSTHGESLVT